MLKIKFKNILFYYDDKIDKFILFTEKHEYITFTNAAEARERFMDEVERPFRKYINECLKKMGFNIHTGRKTNDEG